MQQKHQEEQTHVQKNEENLYDKPVHKMEQEVPPSVGSINSSDIDFTDDSLPNIVHMQTDSAGDGRPKERRAYNTWVKRQRANKILKKVKPKSPLTILNELYPHVTFDIAYENATFAASVTLSGETYTGNGKTKAAAQTEAAEAALKKVVLTKLLADAPEESTQQLEQSHLLSFALYKLLASWDNGSGQVVSMMQQQAPVAKTPVVIKPVKKFPANPENLHPVMLLSQTHPTAEYRQIAASPPPHTSFTIHCVIDGVSYAGVGSKKKIAKRMAAMEACRSLMQVNYDGHSAFM